MEKKPALGRRQTDKQTATPPPPLLQERLSKWQQSSRGPQAGSPQGPHDNSDSELRVSTQRGSQVSLSQCLHASLVLSVLPFLLTRPVQKPAGPLVRPLSKSEISILTLLLLHPSQPSQPCVCPCSYNEALRRGGTPSSWAVVPLCLINHIRH